MSNDWEISGRYVFRFLMARNAHTHSSPIQGKQLFDFIVMLQWCYTLIILRY